MATVRALTATTQGRVSSQALDPAIAALSVGEDTSYQLRKVHICLNQEFIQLVPIALIHVGCMQSVPGFLGNRSCMWWLVPVIRLGGLKHLM